MILPLVGFLFAALPFTTAGSLSSEQSITSNGVPRTFYYYTPTTYDPTLGAILYLHGGGGGGLQSSGAGTDFLWRNLSDRVGVLTVFPNGKAYPSDPTSHTWNDCMDDVRPRQNCETCTDLNDVLFIRDLIAHLGTTAFPTLNLNRIYAVGESKGAQMAQRLALEASDLFAAVGSIAGNLPVSNDNNPSGEYECSGYDAPYTSHAVPILLFKGDADPRIPFGATSGSDHNIYPLDSDWCHRPKYGGVCPPDGGSCVNGCVHSFFDTLAFWEWKWGFTPARDRRVEASVISRDADTVPNCTSSCTACDGSYVIRHDIGRAPPYPVVLERAVGGGHHFPGPVADDAACSIRDSLGWKNRDVLGAVGGNGYFAEEFWEFARQFALGG